MLEQMKQRQTAIDFDPQEPYVEIADEEELQGAVARDPEEEIPEQ